MLFKTKSEDEESKHGNDKCGHCLKVVSDLSNGIICDICCSWFHSKCQGVSELMYKALNQFNQDLFWFCKDCRCGAGKLLPSLASVHAKINHLEDESSKINADLKLELTRTVAILAELKNEISGIGGRMDQFEMKSDSTKLDLENNISSKIVDLETKLLNKEGPKWSDMISQELESTLGTDLKSLQKSVEKVIDSKADVQKTLAEVVNNSLILYDKKTTPKRQKINKHVKLKD